MILEELKNYLRTDSNEDDPLIERLAEIADSYIRNSVSNYDEKMKNADFVKLSDMAKLAIVAELYENRNDAVQKDYSFTIRSIIEQLKWSY